MSQEKAAMASPGESALRHHQALGFWRELPRRAGDGFVLNGPPPDLRPGEAAPRLETERALGPAAAATLLAISRGGELESFVVFLAAAGFLLSRYEDSDTFTAYAPPLPGTATGFGDGLPLALRVAGLDDARALVLAADQAVVDAYEHQDVPASLLPAEARERVWSNVRLAHATLHAPRPPGPDATLALTLEPRADGAPVVRASSAPGAFAPWFVDELLANLEHVIASFGEASSLDRVALAELSAVRPASRAQLLERFNQGFREDASPATLVDRLRAQVARTPEAAAVVSGGARLTYAQLDQRSDELAAHLATAHGIVRGDRVAILMGKSELAVVAILGILKAGAAYVPIDPRLPPARAGFQLRDCASRLLLTEAQLLLAVEGFDGAVMALDVEPVPPAPPGHVPATVAPEELAYVIYTSGSTGEPKGVCISHAAILSYLDWKIAYYGFGPGFVLLQIPPLCFDSSVSDLFAMLLSGASMVLLPDEARLDVPLIRELIARHGVTNLTLVPSHYRVLLEQLAPFSGQLRVITIAGERSSLDLVQRHRQLLPSTRLINEYGPTENSVGATAYDYALGDADGARVGLPQTNTRVRILDRRLRLLPLGAAGEVCLSGPGVARGYLGREQLTREVFVPDPFVPGARMYRTGDLGRFNPDGQLELLGRRDAQVKIRGNRVEPGEVEAALRRLPGVREAVVVARPNAREELELLAYAVADGAPAPASLREALARVLPSSMVPAHVMMLGELPLLPSGKVDGERLPAPPRASEAEREAPRNALEALVASIWAEELRAGPLGLDDDFFGLGGHSLLGVQIVLRVQQALDVQVSLRELLENPTIRRFSEALRHKEKHRVRPIEPVAEAPSYPASHAQRRIWILERLRGQGRAAYNLPDAYDLQGPLGKGEVEAALERLVARHESLRTCFAEVKGELSQRVLPPSAFRMEHRSLAAEPDPERALAESLRAEAARPFELESSPPLRATLYRLGESRHVLGFQLHHIACDGWSAARLVRELLEVLAARREGRDPDLAPLRLQYRDFAAWQQAGLRGGDWEAERGYWLAQLAGPRAVLALPVDFPRPTLRRFEGGVVRARLGAELAREVRAAGQRSGASIFMLLTAAVQALLSRYTGQRDILIGTPVGGRVHPDLEGQVGLYMNTLVLRGDVDPDAPFGALLDQARRAVLAGYEHQQYPFDLLVEELELGRELGRNPLFDVMITLDGRGVDPLVGGETRALGAGLTIRRRAVDYDVSKVDLTFAFLDEGAGEIGVALEYDQHLFRRERMERLARHLETLLADAVGAPERAVGELALLPEDERRAVLVDFNRTQAPRRHGETLLSEFEAQVAQTPEWTAVEAGSSRLSYARLDARASALAMTLRERGLGVGDRVVLVGGRTVGFLERMLAILKCGAAYVPVDRDVPRERLALMADGCRARFVLGEEEAPAGASAGAPADPEEARVAPDRRVAYIIHTSGSTGVPKGVMVEHRGVMNLVRWHQHVFALGEESRSTWFASVGFDASVWEVWPTLLSGGCLVLLPDEVRTDADALLELWISSHVTHAFVPTRVAELIARRPRAAALPKGFVLLTGGETLHPLGRVPFTAVNNYGPTEATVVATSVVLGEEPGGEVPIGRPIDNMRVLVLDGRRQPVPIGVAGELYLGGPGLARGYVGDAELTRERFVADPFHAGERLYRTGDLGCWRADGNVGFLGRRDAQLKVRGYRIEPAEVEGALAAVAGVREAAVTAVPGEGGEARLTALLVGDGGARPDAEALRRALEARLPAWMVPARFVWVEALPRSASGKVDRNGLAALAPDGGESSAEPARSPLEELLAEVWTAVLRVERVGRDDDFFELGGDSILAMRAAARLRDALGRPLDLRAFFEARTVRRLARVLEAAATAKDGAAAPIPRASPEERARAPLSSAQEQLLRVEEQLPGTTSFHMLYGVRLVGALEGAALRAAAGDLMARHEALRTRFRNGAAEIAWPAGGGLVPMTEAELSTLPAAEREAGVQREARALHTAPFALAEGPLWRMRLLRLGEEEHALLLSVHHLIGDGDSLGLLVRELLELYGTRARGQAPAPGEAALHAGDFARWQRRMLASGGFDGALDYWREALGGALPPLTLPLDRPRVARQAFFPVEHGFHLSRAQVADLRRLAQREDCSPFIVFTAAFQILLHRLSGCRDIRVGTLLSGHTRPELEGVVGLLVNTAILRAQVSPELTFRDVLAQVRERVLGAFTHRELPFEALVDTLAAERPLDPGTLFEALLTFQRRPAPQAGGDGPRVEPLPELRVPVQAITTCDLVLALEEGPDGVDAMLTYKSELWNPATIERMVAELLRVLDTMSRGVELPVGGSLEALKEESG